MNLVDAGPRTAFLVPELHGGCRPPDGVAQACARAHFPHGMNRLAGDDPSRRPRGSRSPGPARRVPANPRGGRDRPSSDRARAQAALFHARRHHRRHRDRLAQPACLLGRQSRRQCQMRLLPGKLAPPPLGANRLAGGESSIAQPLLLLVVAANRVRMRHVF